MRLAVTAAVATFLATNVSAMEIGATGISLGATTTSEYKVDAENMTVVFEPELSYAYAGFNMAVSSELSIYDDEFVVEDTLNVLPVIDFKVERAVGANLNAYVETSWDLEESERGEVTLGASFSF